MKTGDRTYKLVMTALMICLITLAEVFVRVPVGPGYVHLGNAIMFLSVLVLGMKYGIAASAIGGLLGDLFGGFAVWAPWTFLICAVMALLQGLFSAKGGLKCKVAGIIIAGLVMIAGYYVAEGVMYGNFIAALADIPANILQFVFGAVIALAIALALCRTPARNAFTYREGLDSWKKD